MKRIAINFTLIALVLVLGAAFTFSQEDDNQKPDDNKNPFIQPEREPFDNKGMVGSMFFVDIASIDVKQTAAGPTFIMKGVSEYPDNTIATVAVRFFEEKLPKTNRRVKIRNKSFEVVFEAAELWQGKKAFPGNYEFEIHVDPKRQSRKQEKAIKDALGPRWESNAYRNKYITIGTKEQMNEELDKLRKHYLYMIKELWLKGKLYDQLEMKYQKARVKFYKKFRKLDQNGNYIINPNNPNAYLVDMPKFRQYLRDNPNQFYDRTGTFLENAWGDWLDCYWRADIYNLVDEHLRVKANYAAIAWPREYDEMTDILKMMFKRSAEKSIQIYKWNGLKPHKNDMGGITRDFDGEWPTKYDKKDIQKKITDIRFRLKLDLYIAKKMKGNPELLDDDKPEPVPPLPPPADKPKPPPPVAEKKSEEFEIEGDFKVDEIIRSKRIRIPAQTRQTSETGIEYLCYFLAFLAILSVLLIMKRRI